MKEELSLVETNLRGSIPEELCDFFPRPDIMADCRNELFQPKIKCSCCSFCNEEKYVWNGNCPDLKLKFTLDTVKDSLFYSTELLEWSINDALTNKTVLGDGKHTTDFTASFVCHLSNKPLLTAFFLLIHKVHTLTGLKSSHLMKYV